MPQTSTPAVSATAAGKRKKVHFEDDSPDEFTQSNNESKRRRTAWAHDSIITGKLVPLFYMNRCAREIACAGSLIDLSKEVIDFQSTTRPDNQLSYEAITRATIPLKWTHWLPVADVLLAKNRAQEQVIASLVRGQLEEGRND